MSNDKKPVKKEIERRWLLKEIPEEIDIIFGGFREVDMRQWYISKSPVLRLRNESNQRFIFCIKTQGEPDEIGKPEEESKLSYKEFENLMKLVITEPIHKTRYYIPLSNDLIAEFDIYHGNLKGMYTVEVEFKTEEQAKEFIAPTWFGKKEITGIYKYANVNLAKELGRKLIFKELCAGMNVKDVDGTQGVISDCSDIHNVLVLYGEKQDKGQGFYCLAENCKNGTNYLYELI